MTQTIGKKTDYSISFKDMQIQIESAIFDVIREQSGSTYNRVFFRAIDGSLRPFTFELQEFILKAKGTTHVIYADKMFKVDVDTRRILEVGNTTSTELIIND
jgi:hypothetical protein